MSICHGCSGHKTQHRTAERQANGPCQTMPTSCARPALRDFVLKPEYLYSSHSFRGDRFYQLSRALIRFIFLLREARLPGWEDQDDLA